MGKVFFDVRCYGGAGAFEVTKSLKFVGYELIVWWALSGQKALEELSDIGRPSMPTIATAHVSAVGCFVFEIVGA